MRALTVRQPWAWAIVHGGKDVENRTRNVAGAYRGPVAIHAGASTEDLDAIRTPLVGDAMRRAQTPDIRTVGDLLVFGAIIGVTELVDVHSSTHCWDATLADDVEGESWRCSPWAQYPFTDTVVVHHLVLANPRPLARPIPWRGALGLWTVPDDLEARIREQVDLP